LNNKEDDDRRDKVYDEPDPTQATQTTSQHNSKRNKKIKTERETTAQREREREREGALSKSRLEPFPPN
jgi:hypothetical protein